MPIDLNELPPRLSGFLRALCAISNGAYSEGGMSCTGYSTSTEPLQFPQNTRSNDAIIGSFFGGALGFSDAHQQESLDHLAQELRRVLRDDLGAEITDAYVEEDPGWCWRLLSVQWRVGSQFQTVELFWSLD